jgi:UDP-N-acetylglucosamine acyltransferase
MSAIHATAMVDPAAELTALSASVPYSRHRPARAKLAPAPRSGRMRDRRPHHHWARQPIFQFNSLGAIPQDKKYAGEPTANW